MAKQQDKIICRNKFKDISNLKENFNERWILLINQLENSLDEADDCLYEGGCHTP